MKLETKRFNIQTVIKEDISEVARMCEYPNITSLEKAEKAIN